MSGGGKLSSHKLVWRNVPRSKHRQKGYRQTSLWINANTVKVVKNSLQLQVIFEKETWGLEKVVITVSMTDDCNTNMVIKTKSMTKKRHQKHLAGNYKKNLFKVYVAVCAI